MQGGADEDRVWQWLGVIDDSTYYEILSVLELADAAAIKQAFHQFALAFHPDRHIGADAELLQAVRTIFRRGVEAYRILANPELRSRYDLALAKGHLRLDGDDVPTGGATTGGSALSLEDICKTAAAKMCARKADDLISVGDLEGAKRELKLALYHDGSDNPDLDERIDALDLALFAMGS